MTKKKYVVVTKDGIDIADLDRELSSQGGSSTVPTREVECVNSRSKNTRMTDYMLTEEEAMSLYEDDRVERVIPKVTGEVVSNIDDKYDKGEFWAFDSHDNAAFPNNSYLDQDMDIFSKGDLRNHGLYIHSGNDRLVELDPQNEDDVKQKYSSGYSLPDGTSWDVNEFTQGVYGKNVHRYTYDGEGIDWVSVDSGILADHPDFNDENGVSRVQKIDWYEETGITGEMHPDAYRVNEDNHGTHVASIACGQKHGWAKKAHIYVCPYQHIMYGQQTTSAERVAEAMDLVLAWHNQKTNGRPTVLNLSIGIRYTEPYANCELDYRGTTVSGSFNNFSRLAAGVPAISVVDGQPIPVGGDTSLSTFDNEVQYVRETIRDNRFNYGTYASPAAAKIYKNGSNYGSLTDGIMHVGGISLYRTMYNQIIDHHGNTAAQEINTLTEQLINAGVHVCIAAGNEDMLNDVESSDHCYQDKFELMGNNASAGSDWNNIERIFVHYEEDDLDGNSVWCRTVNTDKFDNLNPIDPDTGNPHLNHQREYYYQRPAAPYHHKALNVGSVGTKYVYGIYPRLLKSKFSNFGPAVNIWACGHRVMAATGTPRHTESTYFGETPYNHDTVNYPEHDGYFKQTLSGTSMACPQVSGIACLYLQQNPDLTPEELQQLIIKESATERHYDDTLSWSSAEPWAIPKQGPYEAYGPRNYNGLRQTDNVTGSLKVVKAPKSGTGSLTIENDNATTNDVTKTLSLINSSVGIHSDVVVTAGASNVYHAVITLKDANGPINATGLKDAFSIDVVPYINGIASTPYEAVQNGTPVHDNGDGTYQFGLSLDPANNLDVMDVTVKLNGTPLIKENDFLTFIIGDYAELIEGFSFTGDDHEDNIIQVSKVSLGDIRTNKLNTSFDFNTGQLDGALIRTSGGESGTYPTPFTRKPLSLFGPVDYGVRSSYSFKLTIIHTNGHSYSKIIPITINDTTVPSVDFVPDASTAVLKNKIDAHQIDIDIPNDTSQGVLGVFDIVDGHPVTFTPQESLPDFLNYNDETRELSLVGALEYDANVQEDRIHTGTFLAEDEAGNVKTMTIYFDVVQPDIFPPTITSGSTGNTIREYKTYTGSDIHYQATCDDATPVWGLLNENNITPSPYLEIDRNTGAVTSKAPYPVSYAGTTYTVTISCTDRSGNTSTKQVSFPVVETYKGAVDIIAGNYESSAIKFGGTIVYNIYVDERSTVPPIPFEDYTLVCAETRDGYTAGDTFPAEEFVSWSLITPNFAINPFQFFGANTSPNVSLQETTVLDYEALPTSTLGYQVRANYKKNNIAQSKLAGIYVNVQNIDDNAPQWDTSSLNNNRIEIPHGSLANSTMVDLDTLVSDPDGAISDPITYSITSSLPASNYYYIPQGTSTLKHGYTWTTVGYNTSVTVQATDQGSNTNSRMFHVYGLPPVGTSATLTKANSSVYGYPHYGFSTGMFTYGSLTPSTIGGHTVMGIYLNNYSSPYLYVQIDGSHSHQSGFWRYLHIQVGSNIYTLDSYLGSHFIAPQSNPYTRWSFSGGNLPVGLSTSLQTSVHNTQYSLTWS